MRLPHSFHSFAMTKGIRNIRNEKKKEKIEVAVKKGEPRHKTYDGQVVDIIR